MRRRARTFGLVTDKLAPVVRGLGTLLADVSSPSSGLVFLSGDLGVKAERVAKEIASLKSRVPWVVASGFGVLSENGAVDGASAASAIVWSGGRAKIYDLPLETPGALEQTLEAALSETAQPQARSALAFLPPRSQKLAEIGLFRQAWARPILGTGTLENGAFGVHADGAVTRGDSVLLTLSARTRPELVYASGFELLTALEPVTEARGVLLVSSGHCTALDRLDALGKGRRDGELLVVALEPAPGAEHPSGEPVLVARPIVGVDPTRRAVLLASEVHVGQRVAFAAWTKARAQAELGRALELQKKRLAGAAPDFGLYFSSSGNESPLGRAEREALVRALPSVPMLGLRGNFGILTPRTREALLPPTFAFHARALALYTSPS